jgi:putative flippase GtrA
LLLGAIAAGANWCSRFAWSLLMPFSWAVVAAYATGMVVAFALFRMFGFPGASRPLSQQILYFVLVNLAGIAQVWLASIALVAVLFPLTGFSGPLAEALGHGAAVMLPAATSYFGHKQLTFAGARG